MTLDMVGVELDEAGDQKVAVEVLTDGRGAMRDVGDAAVADREAAVNDLLGQHDARVAEDLLAHGCSAGRGTAGGPKGWKA